MVEVTESAAIERFWAKVDIRGDGECWEWTASKSTYGYGRFTVNRKGRPATRIAWELFHKKPFPEGMLACHTCDNPGCVNPHHIWPGTQSDNINDCVAKGRHKSLPKEYCKRGHKMSDANRLPSNKSQCRECARNRTRREMRLIRARKPETPLSERRRRAWETRRSKYGAGGRTEWIGEVYE